MEIIYYKDSKLGYAPVKVYFVAFSNSKKIVIDIKAKIRHIEQQGGFITDCEFCEKANDFDGWKIKQNFNKKVIRILYDLYDGKMILLLAFDKPTHYDNNKERKREKSFYKLAKKYLQNFKNNPNLYEKFQ